MTDYADHVYRKYEIEATNRLVKERDAAHAALARADALVRSIEWGSEDWGNKECPSCGCYEDSGHRADCTLAAYLRDRDGGAA